MRHRVWGVWSVAALLLAAPPGFAAKDKPAAAVVSLKGRSAPQWWHGGGQAAQDVFVTELVASGKFSQVSVGGFGGGVDDDRVFATQRRGGKSGNPQAMKAAAKRAGKRLGVRYLVVCTASGMQVASRLIDTSTGEITWADEARAPSPDRAGARAAATRSARKLVARLNARELALDD